jgi:hypothetical protein
LRGEQELNTCVELWFGGLRERERERGRENLAGLQERRIASEKGRRARRIGSLFVILLLLDGFLRFL